MAQNTSNTTPFIEASRYDSFILANLHDGLLPDNMTRDVSEFGSGTTLNVKSVAPDTPVTAFDCNTITFWLLLVKLT